MPTSEIAAQAMNKPEDFSSFQKKHFEEAEQQRFAWQTTNPFIKQAETAVLTELDSFLRPDSTVLEVGCGEGANLVNLPAGRRVKLAIGVDFSQEKSAFWQHSTRQANVSDECGGLCADGSRLPLADNSF